MKVILKQDLDNLGMAGEVVDVKAGYGRNYLLPRGIALEANLRNVRQLNHQKRIAEGHRKLVEAAAQEQKKGLDGLFLTVERRSGLDGKLFGAVTSRDVAGLLAERDLDISKRRVLLPEPIKRVGEHLVSIRLDQGVTAEIKIIVRGITVAAPEEAAVEEVDSAEDVAEDDLGAVDAEELGLAAAPDDQAEPSEESEDESSPDEETSTEE